MWLWPRAGNGESFGADPTIKLDVSYKISVFEVNCGFLVWFTLTEVFLALQRNLFAYFLL